MTCSPSHEGRGRPEKYIDWDIVDQMITNQCTATEIAGEFHMHLITFLHRLKEKHNESFTNYANPLYSKGKRKLRSVQYEKAIEGNVQLLIKLGEVYLDQNSSNIPMPLNDELNEVRHELMLTKAELAGYKEANANKS